LGNNNKMECGLFVYTNCSLVPTNIAAWTQAVIFGANSTFALPCSRIDKLWINPSTGTAVNQCASVAGAYLTCPAPPASFVRTTQQQVEYRPRTVSTSFDWNAQNSSASSINRNGVFPLSSIVFKPTLNSCCEVLYLKEMKQGISPNGWLVRYRNINTGCLSAPAATTPSANWPAGTFTTEYWIY
jgi:hypothetical protein